MSTTGELLRTEGLTKIFPGVVAVDNVDFDVRMGEIHALVGENGAGKSTLIKILGGVYLPDGGKILLDGNEVAFSSTHQSQLSKISVIYQEFNLVPDLTIAENIFIGREPKTTFGTLIDFRKMNTKAAEILAILDMPLNVKNFVADISVAERQMVEIAKALSHESRLIVMDEPTATLTEKEVRKIFEIVRNLRARGVSIIYISHRLEEAFELADRITVMRDGRKVGTKLISETNKSDIIEMMVGKVVKDYFAPRAADANVREPLLEVRGYSVADGVEDISFTLYKGEILALAGVLGSGVDRLLQSLFGAIPKKSGEILFEGRSVTIEHPRDAIKLGIGYVTEDRKGAGILPAMSVLHNLTIIKLRALTFLRWLFIRDREETRQFEAIRAMLDIKISGPGQRIIYLSGGNQQKVLIGRTLIGDCKVLILLEPTRGIDVGAKAEIHRMLRELADKGLSVILTSSELPELVNLPDRCIVLYKGRMAAEFNRETMDSEKIVAAQIGQSTGGNGEPG